MPFFNFNKKSSAISISSDKDIINFLNPQSAEYISADQALRNSDIYSIIMQLSGDLATSHLTAKTKRSQSILDNPSATTNSYSFWRAMYAQLLLGGEAFAYRWRNQNGVDKRWEYLRPSQVNVFLLEDGSGLVYNVTFDEPEIGVKQAVPQSDLIHFRLISRNGGMTGISPLTALTDELHIKSQSNGLTLNALKQSVNVPSILKVKNGSKLDTKSRASRSREIVKQINHSNNGPLVIDDLEDYTPLEIKSNVAQLLDQVNWTGKQIAKVFGIPDSYLNGQGDQQSNIDQIKGMYANALNRYMQSIISELSNKLNCEIKADIRPAIDSLNTSYANNISNITKSGVLAQNQAVDVLQRAGYLPEDLPQPTNVNPTKGGENADEDD